MSKAVFVSVALLLCVTSTTADCQQNCNAKRRRYDVKDLGYENYFHGWVDVQGLGGANDYCRLVGNEPNIFLACALGGTHGQDEYNYKSVLGFDKGYTNTWYMKDEDEDGRDDYCRCVGVKDETKNTLRVECMKAGEKGFFGSEAQGGSQYTFSPTGAVDCNTKTVRPEFGYPQWDSKRFD